MPEVDLNLLRVFDALIELRSVTRVADRLGLTQSAVSHALGRLRRMLDDPLFVRGPRGLQPSARAEQIAPGIQASLRQLHDALAPSQFDPGHATRSFTIAAGAYFCTLFIPPLLERIRSEAPQISLHVVPLVEDGAAMLDRGLVDLALTATQAMPTRFVVDALFDEEMVWVAARHHPLASQPPNIEAILRTPRVRLLGSRLLLTSPSLAEGQDPATGSPIEVDPHPAKHAPATVYDSLTAAAIVARTDMVACIPRRIAERARQDIVVLTGAGRPDIAGVAMIWHSRHRSDAGLTWLRAAVMEVALRP